MGQSYRNNINLFIAVLERSHCVEYVETLNYEKNPNIDQDINNFMYSRLPNRLREVPKILRKNGQFGTDERPRPFASGGEEDLRT